ncbi:protocatechuate 3,4-dioxygenase subunit beta [Actinomadura parmotrematis]|uniref:Protocatechuate 3,4-dioxygenase subunit beta n=1 Tax=Actinomadura parmotrematis TaxID=2864039 RepID=A0ABS7FPU5_9ACTN|nr:protocatechuate 3,4-dioxygenase subunit beta [Actinomadura parmotrematis]MBW8482404.1 protocatechuate 3,4-dioxygenase subunit beta [Actinomadura parmotrematis]
MSITEPAAHPLYLSPDYASTVLRAPSRGLLEFPADPEAMELTGPVFGEGEVTPGDADLTTGRNGDPIGERIVVTGRVLDAAGRPVRNTLVELWQANAAGRYDHPGDVHPAPIDPNFSGAGRALTDDAGEYRFVTIKPGPYPWRNHHNAWRPAHLHFSVFGTAFTQRLVTQMYFPGDPLFPFDPIMQSVRDEAARARMVSAFDWDTTVPEWALGFRFDIVLGRTPVEDA